MFIKSFKISNKLKYILPISLILVLLVSIYFDFFHNSSTLPTSVTPDPLHGIWQSDGNMTIENTTIDSQTNENKEEKKYIKWFEFNVCYDALVKTAKLDVDSHVNGEAIQYNWIELISYLACKYGNDFSKFKQKDLDTLVEKLKSGQTMADLTKDLKNYSYYFEGYDAVLHEFIGEYQKEIAESTTKNVQNSQNAENVENTENIENTQNLENSSKGVKKPQFETTYGLKAFHPVAKNYAYSHYDDFGNSRSYGYKRLHFGNDLMGSIGTPIVAVESGIIEAVGWNQYGGWRIGIRSFDKKRYYYYAHLRKNHHYAEGIEEGKVVTAGDVIGYLGMTGYSTKENVNNINVPHLHFGLQLIFDEVQKEGPNQIWVDLYDLVDFLKKNRSEVFKSNPKTKDYSRKYQILDPIVPTTDYYSYNS